MKKLIVLFPLLLLVSLLAASVASAQGVISVTNIGSALYYQRVTTATNQDGGGVEAIKFTAGNANSGHYFQVTKVRIHIDSYDTSSSTGMPQVAIYTASNNQPDVQVGSNFTFASSVQGTGRKRYTAPDVYLSPNTDYFVVVRRAYAFSLRATIQLEQAAHAGWDLADERRSFTQSGGWTSGLPLLVEVSTTQVAPTVPSKATGVGATVGDGSITLSWDEYQPTVVRPFTRYRVSADATYPINGVQHWVVHQDEVTDRTTTSYTWTGLRNGHDYNAQVEVCNAHGCSGWATVQAGPSNAAPGRVVAYQPTSADGSITFTWDKYVQEYNRAPFTRYQVFFESLEPSAPTTHVYVNDINTTSYTWTGLTNGNKHGFFMQVCNQYSCGGNDVAHYFHARPGTGGL